MRYLSVLLLTVLASPALAASGPFFSLHNTDFVVTVAFIGFVALVLYLGVPKMLGKMLDARADGIRSELEEARSLHEEAKALLASYEKKQSEVQAQANRRPRASRLLRQPSRPRLTSKTLLRAAWLLRRSRLHPQKPQRSKMCVMKQ